MGLQSVEDAEAETEAEAEIVGGGGDLRGRLVGAGTRGRLGGGRAGPGLGMRVDEACEGRWFRRAREYWRSWDCIPV